jgi:hypothetical protein
MCTLCRLVLITFLLAFLILFRCFLCILPLYQGVPYAFNEIDFLLINKKKKNWAVLLVHWVIFWLVMLLEFLFRFRHYDSYTNGCNGFFFFLYK